MSQSPNDAANFQSQFNRLSDYNKIAKLIIFLKPIKKSKKKLPNVIVRSFMKRERRGSNPRSTA